MESFNPSPQQKEEEQKQKQSYSGWLREQYNIQYEKWYPWIEDQYLRWFGKGDNKASYVAKCEKPSIPILLYPRCAY
jgi:hypothetical protein